MVKADDDVEYISFNDLELWNAYYYWQLHGLSADKETSYTNTLNTISQGTSSGSFSFSGSFSGSFDANVELAISGLTSTELDDVDDILTSRTFYYFGEGSESNPLIEMSISSDGQGSEYIPRYACSYNPSATGASATMTCTPNTYDGAFTMPNQDIKVTSIDVAMNSLTDYNLTLTLKNENTVRGTLSGTLGLSGNGQGTLSLTNNGTASTTSINTNSLEFVLPIMTGTINSGVIANRRVLIPNKNNNHLVIAALCTRLGTNGLSNTNITDIVNSSNVSIRDNVTVDWHLNRLGGFQISYVEMSANKDIQANILWNNNNNLFNYGIIPLFVGMKSTMSNDLYRFIYGKDRTIDAIEAQTAADQQHHDEMMDTSDSSKIQTDGDALVNDADEKFGDLFFPLNHAIETANDMANVNATGIIRLPAIFSNGDYWYLDLTQIEQNLPEAWSFIQSLCQLAVSIYLIHGLYSLFFGGKEDDS